MIKRTKYPYYEFNRVEDEQKSFRLLRMKTPEAKSVVGLRVMDYRLEGNDCRAGSINLPLHVARELAFAILAEIDGAAK